MLQFDPDSIHVITKAAAWLVIYIKSSSVFDFPGVHILSEISHHTLLPPVLFMFYQQEAAQ